jgi:hypothetical protein
MIQVDFFPIAGFDMTKDIAGFPADKVRQGIATKSRSGKNFLHRS